MGGKLPQGRQWGSSKKIDCVEGKRVTRNATPPPLKRCRGSMEYHNLNMARNSEGEEEGEMTNN